MSLQNSPFLAFSFAGAGFGISNKAFMECGGFWEQINYAREEEELSIAIINRGYRILFDPIIQVSHYAAEQDRLSLSKRRYLELENGLLIYWRRFPLLFSLIMIPVRISTMTGRCILENGETCLGYGMQFLVQSGNGEERGLSAFPCPSPLRLNISDFIYQNRVRVFMKNIPRVDILGCPFDAISFSETVAVIKNSILSKRKTQIVPGSIDFVMKARKDPAFRDNLWRAELVIADGVPIVWAASLLGNPIRGRVSGTDLVWECARLSRETRCPIALIGGRYENTLKAAAVMANKFQNRQYIRSILHSP